MSAVHLPDADDAAVVDQRRSWGAAKVAQAAGRIAQLVRSPTDGARRRVAVFADNDGEVVIAHLGGLRSGASVVAVNAQCGPSPSAPRSPS